MSFDALEAFIQTNEYIILALAVSVSFFLRVSGVESTTS